MYVVGQCCQGLKVANWTKICCTSKKKNLKREQRIIKGTRDKGAQTCLTMYVNNINDLLRNMPLSDM